MEILNTMINIKDMLNLAINIHNTNNLKIAKELYLKILYIDSLNVDALHLIGVIALQEKDYNESINFITKALEINPSSSIMQMNLGSANKGLGLFEESITCYIKSINLDSNNYQAHANLASAYKHLKQYEKSIFHYSKALSINPNLTIVYYNLGNLYVETNNFELAIINYNLAINNDKFYTEAYYNLGFVYQCLNLYTKAIYYYNEVILLDINHQNAYLNRGLCYYKTKDYDNSIIDYEKSIDLNNNLIEANYNLGILYIDLKKYNVALNCFIKVYNLNKNYLYTINQIIYLKLILSEWNGINELISNMFDNSVMNIPFVTLLIKDDPLFQFESAIKYNQYNEFKKSDSIQLLNYQKNKKIKIGYFSSDFHIHPLSIWLIEQLNFHSKEKFELFGFSFNLVSDTIQESYIHIFDHWFNVESMSDDEIVKLSRKLCIDIAIDLGGHTFGNRNKIFALGVAPIQINHLGYPGSTGSDYLDYSIFDNYSITEISKKYFKEKLILLPSIFSYDKSRLKISIKKDRSFFGLPEDKFIFINFNNSYKITSDVFLAWLKILKLSSNSVLYLLLSNPTSMKNLQTFAANFGINHERLIFAEKSNDLYNNEQERVAHYLSSLKLSNLYLDTWPYNSGTTAHDALLSGLPLLTKVGNSVASRMAGSALNSLNLNELIAPSIEEYINIAVDLSINKNKYEILRKKLENNLISTKSYDSALIMSSLELSLEKIYYEKNKNSFIL
jgi:protein O-GlcNAc transferase